MKFQRNCPNCNIIILYGRLDSLNIAIRKNTLCKDCYYKTKSKLYSEIVDGHRKWRYECPICSSFVWYSSREDFYRKNKQTRICKKCKKIRYLEQIEKKKLLNLEKFKRNCPKCNCSLRYTNKANFLRAQQDNSQCRRCGKIGNVSRKGQINSEEHNNKVSLALSGRSLSVQLKTKLRKSAIRRIERSKFNGGQMMPNYNPKACRIFDEINKHFQWLGQHAENGGEYHIEELGYWVDYYEPILNIVIEFDERRHKSKRDKDMLKEKEITEFLGCVFYRLNENENWITLFRDK